MSTKRPKPAARPQPSPATNPRSDAGAKQAALNRRINVAATGKLAALRSDAYFRERAARPDFPGAPTVLDRLGVGNAPLPGDRAPDFRKRNAQPRGGNRTNRALVQEVPADRNKCYEAKNVVGLHPVSRMKRETSARPDTASPNQQTAGEAQRTLSSPEKVAQQRIGDLRRRLLDLGNSNRLLNYKFSNRGRRQIRLVDESPDELLRKLLDGKRLVLKALPELGDQPADEKSDQFLLALDQAKRSDEEYLAALNNLNEDDDEPVRRIERALRDRLPKMLGMPDRRLPDQTSRAEWAKRNGIEPSFDLPAAKNLPKPFHLDDDIQTLLLPEEMERTLSGIHDQARTALQEKGVNTLYLALGYLEWYEALDSQTPVYPPLLLHPADIERTIQRARYRYSIGSLGDETKVNITLSERLHHDFHRRPPGRRRLKRCFNPGGSAFRSIPNIHNPRGSM